MELLGPMPKSFALAGKQFDKFFEYDAFSGTYNFKKIQDLKHYPLKNLLIDKYHLKVVEAEQLSDFLMKILKWHLSDRATAKELLDHPWLKMPDDYSFRMSDLEFKKYNLKQSIETANLEFLEDNFKGKP